MTFWEVADAVYAREYFVTHGQSITQAVGEVLEGFYQRGDEIDLDEATEHAENLTHGRRLYTTMGYEVDKKCLEMAIRIKKGLSHPQHTNRAGRQVCCHICHVCLLPLRECLDGEQWCAECQTYR